MAGNVFAASTVALHGLSHEKASLPVSQGIWMDNVAHDLLKPEAWLVSHDGLEHRIPV